MRFPILLTVYISLVVLLALTIGLAFLPLGPHLKPIVGLLVAATKAVLIVLVFMRVHRENGLVHVFAAAGTFWLLILFILTFGDYLTREWL